MSEEADWGRATEAAFVEREDGKESFDIKSNDQPTIVASVHSEHFYHLSRDPPHSAAVCGAAVRPPPHAAPTRWGERTDRREGYCAVCAYLVERDGPPRTA